jgi:hypothetical protein
MPSPHGAGSDITLQDALDLLHKLSTESTKVVALLDVSPRVGASAFGVVRAADDSTVWVTDDAVPPSLIRFDPCLAVRRTYGDSRTISPPSEPLPRGFPRLASSLCFVFPDGSTVCLFEPSDEP